MEENKKRKEKEKREERREDKIFNNRYNQGEGLKGPNEYEYNKGIQVESSYSKSYLNDLYDYENNVEYKIFLDHIFEIIEQDKELKESIKEKDGTRNKFNKEEINFLFDRITSILDKETEYETFSNSIYVLEAISSITAMDYKKIFDFLEYQYRETLLTDLNKKYKFLDWKMNKNKNLH
jgi:hypothetical protein